MPDRLAKTKPKTPSSELLAWLAAGEKIVGGETMKAVRRAVAEQLYENLVFSEYRLACVRHEAGEATAPKDPVEP